MSVDHADVQLVRSIGVQGVTLFRDYEDILRKYLAQNQLGVPEFVECASYMCKLKASPDDDDDFVDVEIYPVRLVIKTLNYETQHACELGCARWMCSLAALRHIKRTRHPSN